MCPQHWQFIPSHSNVAENCENLCNEWAAAEKLDWFAFVDHLSTLSDDKLFCVPQQDCTEIILSIEFHLN